MFLNESCSLAKTTLSGKGGEGGEANALCQRWRATEPRALNSEREKHFLLVNAILNYYYWVEREAHQGYVAQGVRGIVKGEAGRHRDRVGVWGRGDGGCVWRCCKKQKLPDGLLSRHFSPPKRNFPASFASPPRSRAMVPVVWTRPLPPTSYYAYEYMFCRVPQLGPLCRRPSVHNQVSLTSEINIFEKNPVVPHCDLGTFGTMLSI